MVVVVQENLYTHFFFLLVCILLCRETDVSRFDGEALQFIQQLLAKNLNASYKF